MTMPIKFDTLEYAKRLAEAGIPADQADAHAQALSDALATASVTPAELVLVRSELLARMDLLKSEVYARIDLLKVEIDARFDRLNVEIDARFDLFKREIDARFDLFKMEFDARFERFEVRLERLEARVEQLEARFEEFKTELYAYIDTRFESKLRPLRWLLGIALAGQAVTLGLVALILTRLPG